jgi:hypothetical protein
MGPLMTISICMTILVTIIDLVKVKTRWQSRNDWLKRFKAAFRVAGVLCAALECDPGKVPIFWGTKHFNLPQRMQHAPMEQKTKDYRNFDDSKKTGLVREFVYTAPCTTNTPSYHSHIQVLIILGGLGMVTC